MSFGAFRVSCLASKPHSHTLSTSNSESHIRRFNNDGGRGGKVAPAVPAKNTHLYSATALKANGWIKGANGWINGRDISQLIPFSRVIDDERAVVMRRNACEQSGGTVRYEF